MVATVIRLEKGAAALISAAPTLHRELSVAVDELAAISDVVGLGYVMRLVDGVHVTTPEWTPILDRVRDLRMAASAEADENRRLREALADRAQGQTIAEKAADVQYAEAERLRAENATLRHELGRLQSMLALDAPYAVHDVLTQLADAADHLDRDHNCDRDGWEVTRAAAESARRIVAALVGYKPPERDTEIKQLQARVTELEARLLTHTEATSPTGVGVVFGGPA
jgi:hypothetical protein